MVEIELGIGSRINHPTHGKGVVTQINPFTYSVMFIDEGEKRIKKDDPDVKIIERIEPDEDPVSLLDVEIILTNILKKWAGEPPVVHLGERWKKGTLIMQPFDDSLKPKEIPIENFFHKIVMLRDRLRVMEQKINSNKKLDDDDKIDLQQYITRIYGTLTTFNVLFKLKDDQFKGESSR